MGTANVTFNHLAGLFGGTFVFDWEGKTYKAALLDGTIALDPATHTLWSQVSASEINFAGYAAGGIALANKAIDSVSGSAFFRASSVLFEGLTTSVRYVVVYETISGTLTNYLDLNTLGDPIVLTDETLEITWSSNYLFAIQL